MDLVAYGIPGGFAAAYLEDIVSGIIPLVGGLGMLFGSHKLKAGRRMRKKIENIVGRADHVSIQEIADAIPCSYDKCCRYLEDCTDNGSAAERTAPRHGFDLCKKNGLFQGTTVTSARLLLRRQLHADGPTPDASRTAHSSVVTAYCREDSGVGRRAGSGVVHCPAPMGCPAGTEKGPGGWPAGARPGQRGPL